MLISTPPGYPWLPLSTCLLSSGQGSQAHCDSASVGTGQPALTHRSIAIIHHPPIIIKSEFWEKSYLNHQFEFVIPSLHWINNFMNYKFWGCLRCVFFLFIFMFWLLETGAGSGPQETVQWWTGAAGEEGAIKADTRDLVCSFCRSNWESRWCSICSVRDLIY